MGLLYLFDMGAYVTLCIWYEDYCCVVCDAVYFGT
jgi:hypothetical protein